MSIEFRCVQCQKLLRTPDGTDGKRVKCPSCGTEMRIPTVDQAADAGGSPPGAPADSGFSETLPHSGSPGGAPAPPPPPPTGPSDAGASPFGAAPPPPPPGGGFENPYQTPGEAGLAGGDAPVVAGAYQPTQIDVGDVMGRAWTIFRAQMWNCVVPGLLLLGINIGLSIVMQIIVGAVTAAADETAGMMAYGGSQIFSFVISTWLNLGLVIYFLKIARGQSTDIGDLFRGGPYLLRALGGWILFFIAFYIGLILCVVPGVYIALRYGLFSAVIVDRDAGVFESFSVASDLSSGNKLSMFVLGIIAFLLAILGFLMLCVGIIFTSAYTYAIFSVMFVAMCGQATAERFYSTQPQQPPTTM